MAKFEETTINYGAKNKGMNAPKGKQGNSTWKAVTIGGLTGIFFGTASTVGSNILLAMKRGKDQAIADAEKEKENLEENSDALKDAMDNVVAKATPKSAPAKKAVEKEAAVEEKEEAPETSEPKPDETDGAEQAKESEHVEEKSFTDTFQEAREAQGPGGLFVWDGKICTTYTEEEWNSLTDEEREVFAMNAQTFSTDNPNDTEGANAAIEDPSKDIAASSTTGSDDKVEESKEGSEEPAKEDNVIDDGAVDVSVSPVQDTDEELIAQNGSQDELQEEEEADVQIIGTRTITLPNGQEADVAHARINDEDVAVIDIDRDGVGDIAMADLNNNGIPDEGEIIDLHTKEIISTGNYAQADQVQPETDPSVGSETDSDPAADDASLIDDSGLNFTA